jgi:hypothetical protein
MKTLTLLFITLLGSIGCTSKPGSITVDPNGVITATGAQKLGGRSMVYAKNDKTTIVISDDNEGSFKEFNKSLRFGAGALAATSIADTITGGVTSVKNAKTAADVSKTGLVEGTKKVGLEQATIQKGMELEFEALKLGAGE